jgi:hypothetical protein
MLKALLLILALGVTLTCAATHLPTGFDELSHEDLTNREELMKTLTDVAAARAEEGGSRKARELVLTSIIDTYDDRDDFNAAAPGLPVEDFEGSKALAGFPLPCGGNPLDSGETVCYDTGSIEPGLGVLAANGTGVVSASNAVTSFGVPTTWVGANTFNETTSLVFTATTKPKAVGLDFFDLISVLGPTFLDITITYEDGAIETVSLGAGQGSRFFGVITDKPIEEMKIGGLQVILVDNVAFGIIAPPPCDAACDGDPHFKTWRGQRYDYHGECDLVLLQSKEFESGLGLDVHIRTTIRRDMSYISSAVIRIGKDVLEVESQGVYWLNGALNADMPDEFSGFAFSHAQPTDKQHVFEVHLGGRERVKVKTYKDFVSVLIEQGENKHFGDSAGLMGDFRTGHMIARDGNTVIEDANAFGQEWQVLDTEPSLFQTVRLPQHPNVCTMPTPVQADHLRRRLAETSLVDEAAAEKACEHWGDGKDDCVFDVLATGDLEMAVVGAY